MGKRVFLEAGKNVQPNVEPPLIVYTFSGVLGPLSMLHLKNQCKTVLNNIFLSNRIVINVPNFCSYSDITNAV
jgi:hypothetical protein